MQTGFHPRKTVALSGVCVVLTLVASPLAAQRLGVIGIGAFGRLGSLPAAFDQGVPVAIEAAVQWPIAGWIQLATSADLTVQRVGTQSSFVGNGLDAVNHVIHRPFSFAVAHFGLGPAFLLAPTSRMRISGSLQAVGMVPSWSSASVGTCQDTCALLGPSARSQQAEFHLGAAARLRVMFGTRKERLGFELLAIGGPHHSKSRIPLSSVALLVVVGAS